jgi:hypothetical protein
MQASIFIARLLGPMFVVVGVALLVKPRMFRTILSEFTRASCVLSQPPFPFLTNPSELLRSGRGEADPVARAAPNRRGIIIGRPDRPSSIVPPNRNITKVEIDGAAGGLTIGPSRSGSIAPPKPKCAAPDSSATTRQGIKSTIPPARNVGEKARRRLVSSLPAKFRTERPKAFTPKRRTPRAKHPPRSRNGSEAP